MHFPIDGPGGEIIETVEVNLVDLKSLYGEPAQSFYGHRKLRSFKISTNYGNSFHFQPAGDAPDELPLRPMVIAPGTTITGFYASQNPEMGLISLGVISEVIRRIRERCITKPIEHASLVVKRNKRQS
ncbi:hypothetical protein HO173_002459 [Letharia columbiana]|uniref:Uncharacterized protein n=1 Tax=Letharia columbiana TaxID=112416 RepID=A0A8H6L891_9LECA|nr:uncharacterized protein HO173_002459 [Letharia columbiana]KAF6239198.1 hypothetical protein HO173_002459 [Letharia columbiana]